MKNLVLLPILLLTLTFFSCKGHPENSNNITESKPVADELTTVLSSSNEANSPIHITKTDFLNLVMDYENNTEVWVYRGEKPCLIDFYADWCAPCRITSPILEDLANEYGREINIYKVDVEQEEELAAVFGISSIPTFLFCPMEGNPTISSGIANTPEATRDLFIRQIEELLLKTNTSPAI